MVVQKGTTKVEMLVDQWENYEVDMMVVKTELIKADETVD